MQRQQEAVVYCPLNQLRGGTLVPDPPSAADVVGAVAACAYAEVKLQLLDFSQVGRAREHPILPSWVVASACARQLRTGTRHDRRWRRDEAHCSQG